MQLEADIRRRPAPLDRLAELVNIGAGHASDALARLLGGSFWMRVPRVALGPGALPRPGSGGGGNAIFFEVTGPLPGIVAWLVPAPTRAALLGRVLGRPAAEIAPAEADSALCEVGNIVVSHVVSAIGDTLGATLVPSTPSLARGDARSALETVAASRCGEGAPRIEVEIVERGGDLGFSLVFLALGSPSPPSF